MGRWEPNGGAGWNRRPWSSTSSAGSSPRQSAEIARRAGLTERTFFRHFSDKREVLFAGAAALQDFLVTALAGAPDSAAPLDAVAAALEATGDLFQSAVTTPGSGRPSSPRTPSSGSAS